MAAVQSEALGGTHSYVLYGAESNYNTIVTATTHFGIVNSFKSTINNNLNEHRGFKGTTTGGRDIVKFTPGVLDVSFNIDMKVTNWAFLKYVLGTEGGTGPYTYTGAEVPGSLTVTQNIDNPGTSADDLCETYSGSVVDSCNFKTSVGEAVTCTLNFKAAKLIIGTTLSSAVVLTDDNIYNFTGGSIEVPTGTVIPNIIDSIDVTISNNQDILKGLGSRLGQKALPKERNYKIKVTLKYLSNTLVTAALGATTPTATGGPTENATIKLTFASGSRSLVATFTGVPMSDFARSIEINTPIGEDIDLTAKSLSAVETRA